MARLRRIDVRIFAVYAGTYPPPKWATSNPAPRPRLFTGTGLPAFHANVTRDEQIGRITELQDFIRSQPADLTEFDEVLVKRWVQKITVWPDRYTVELKSGLSVDIEG